MPPSLPAKETGWLGLERSRSAILFVAAAGAFLALSTRSCSTVTPRPSALKASTYFWNRSAVAWSWYSQKVTFTASLLCAAGPPLACPQAASAAATAAPAAPSTTALRLTALLAPAAFSGRGLITCSLHALTSLAPSPLIWLSILARLPAVARPARCTRQCQPRVLSWLVRLRAVLYSLRPS